jgi:uncharacterized membrane protein
VTAEGAVPGFDLEPAVAGRLSWDDPELPVAGSVALDIPVERVWDVFADVRGWPTWNPCMWRARVQGGQPAEGARLRWVFNPIKPQYLYKLPATATIVEYEPHHSVTWEVTALPGFHALHAYRFADLGGGKSAFGSWEVAEGPLYRATRRFWLAHFRYVCQASLDGARSLH